MQKKLTLRLDEGLIDYAKRHAEEHGTSVSRVVANYFAALSARETASPQGSSLSESSPAGASQAEASREARRKAGRKSLEDDLPPLTRSLLGAFAVGDERPFAPGEDGSDLSKNELRSAYYDHLETKHR